MPATPPSARPGTPGGSEIACSFGRAEFKLR
jgi:hypothetical protein